MASHMKFTTQTKIRKAKSTISTSLMNGERECLKREKALMACKVVPEDDDKVDDEAVKRPQFLVSLDHMKRDQREKLMKVLADYPEIFRTEPRRTTVLENMIHLTDPTPIRQRHTREPHSPIEKGDSNHGSNRTINHCEE